VSHETIRFWWNRFGPMFATDAIERKRAEARRTISLCQGGGKRAQ
jgi:putative transposase